MPWLDRLQVMGWNGVEHAYRSVHGLTGTQLMTSWPFQGGSPTAVVAKHTNGTASLESNEIVGVVVSH